MLQRADSMCGRRLAREFEGGVRSHDPVNRSRIRDAFLAVAARRPRRAPGATGRRLRRTRPRSRARGARSSARRRTGTSTCSVTVRRSGRRGGRRTNRPEAPPRRRMGGPDAAHGGRRSRAPAVLAVDREGPGRGPAGARRAAGRVPPVDAVAGRGAAAVGLGRPRCAAWCANAPSNPTSDPRSPNGSSNAWHGSTHGSRTRPPSRGTTAAAAVSSPPAPSTGRARTTATGATCSPASCT